MAISTAWLNDRGIDSAAALVDLLSGCGFRVFPPAAAAFPAIELAMNGGRPGLDLDRVLPLVDAIENAVRIDAEDFFLSASFERRCVSGEGASSSSLQFVVV